MIWFRVSTVGKWASFSIAACVKFKGDVETCARRAEASPQLSWSRWIGTLGLFFPKDTGWSMYRQLFKYRQNGNKASGDPPCRHTVALGGLYPPPGLQIQMFTNPWDAPLDETCHGCCTWFLRCLDFVHAVLVCWHAVGTSMFRPKCYGQNDCPNRGIIS